MFTPAVQRIVWKEFRAQRAIWFGIAFELVLLQLWQGMFPQYFQINLFSIACVLTGVLAMTSSALLFAGESEAQTDGFLRQLPFRSRDLLLGKLGFCLAAVTSFLGFSLLSAMLVDVLTSGGNLQSREFDGMMVYANMIGGLWAWGIFYSLITRKVMWTLAGAGLTEIFVNVVLYGTKGYWHPDPTVTAIYRGVVLVVLLVDAWLLSRWYSGGNLFVGISHSMASLEADELTLASPRPLPWARSWKIASRAGGAFGVIWYILLFASASENRGMDSLYLPVIALGCLVGAVIGAIVVIGLRTFRLISPGHFPRVSELRTGSHAFRFSFVLKHAFRLLGLFGVCILALALGIVVGFCSVFLLIVGFVEWPPGHELFFVVSVSVTSTLVGGLVLWGVGRLLDSSEKKHTPRLAIRTLQFAQSTFQSITRSWGSLLWVEARRAVPFLVVGAVILGLTGAGFFWFSRDVGAGLSFWGLLLTSYICGLMTILPDRSPGTLSLPIERGVPAHRILAVKIVVWGLTLAILAVIPMVVCIPQWSSLGSRINEEQAKGLLGELQLIQTPQLFSPATQIFLCINTGLFAVGALSAAWIRRPILAVISGLVGVIVWLIWCVALVENNILFWAAFIWPIVLSFIGYFMSGTTTLLEQANWKSKVRRVAWVILIVGGSLFWLRDFRIHEISRLGATDICQFLLTRHAENLNRNVVHFQLAKGHKGWKTAADTEASILELNMQLPTCNLDDGLNELAIGLEEWDQKSRLAKTELELVEASKMRRLVLAAIRRWANHPSQTTELLEMASQKFASLAGGAQFGANDLLAYQYASAIQAIQPGTVPTRSLARQQPIEVNPLVRSLLRLSGEQERVRQLVDLEFSILPDYIASVSPLADRYEQFLTTQCAIYSQNTSLSLDVLGVHIPPMTYVRMLRDEMKQNRISSQATMLVIQLQLWRSKNGQFPPSLVDVIKPGQHDSSLFGYEPLGFTRNLRVGSMRALPSHQPVIYYLGDHSMQGLELVDAGIEGRAFYRARCWLLDAGVLSSQQYLALQNMSPSRLAIQTQILAEWALPVRSNEIRFVCLGSSRVDDKLILDPEYDKQVMRPGWKEQNSFEELMKFTEQAISTETNPAHENPGSMSPSAEPASTVPPTPEIPPAPPESQAAESAPE